MQMYITAGLAKSFYIACEQYYHLDTKFIKYGLLYANWELAN